MDDVERGAGGMAATSDGPAIVAIENSSPEIIHVMNTSSPNARSLAGLTQHMVTLPSLGSSGHQVQTITINAGGLSFPVALPAAQAQMVSVHTNSHHPLATHCTL